MTYRSRSTGPMGISETAVHGTITGVQVVVPWMAFRDASSLWDSGSFHG